MSQRPVRHHVLPQFYLRAWADAQGIVAMRDRSDRPELRTGTTALAVEKDFYSFEGPDGEKDSSVEEGLAKIDAEGAAVHKALRNLEFPLAPEQKDAFSTWLGLQWVRGRSSRASGSELADKLQKMLIRFGLENAEIDETQHDGAPKKPDPIEQKRDRLIEESAGPGVPIPDFSHLDKSQRDTLATELDEGRFVLHRAIQLRTMLQAAPEAAVPFREAEWHLLPFEDHVLFTSDEPILLDRLPRPENQFLGIGPASADSLSVPLAPSLCLLMMQTPRAGRETIRNLDTSHAEAINRASIATWWSQLFRCPGGPPFPATLPPLPDERIVIG
ncbi:MAG: DUF4238 domain-containing protein [Actinobacteria bacterium]|nr:DUF4238 domain-containing protein [Actinomycetota bacterium]